MTSIVFEIWLKSTAEYWQAFVIYCSYICNFSTF